MMKDVQKLLESMGIRPLDTEAWERAAAEGGLTITFGQVGAGAPECLEEFFEGLPNLVAEQWTEDSAQLQLSLYGQEYACTLRPVADNEATAGQVIEHMPHLLPILVEVLGVTRYLFSMDSELPGHPEIVVVGGGDLSGKKTIGWFEIKRYADGRAFLANWTLFDDAEVSCWLMELLESPDPRVLH